MCDRRQLNGRPGRADILQIPFERRRRPTNPIKKSWALTAAVAYAGRSIRYAHDPPGFLGTRTDPSTITEGYCPRVSTEPGGHFVDTLYVAGSAIHPDLRFCGRGGGIRTHDLLTPRALRARVGPCRAVP